jgi:hypothetical protein
VGIQHQNYEWGIPAETHRRTYSRITLFIDIQ